MENNIPVRQPKNNTVNQENNAQTTIFKSSIAQAMDEAQLKLIPFVERQIELMNNKLLFNGTTPTFDELAEKLVKYEETMLGLTSLYEMKKWDLDAIKEEYEEWFAEKFTEIRDLLNPRDTPASKFYSAKEIEYVVLTKYKDERAQLFAKRALAERELSTIQRLLDAWKGYQFILSNLSANARAEAQALNVSPDLNLDEND